MAKLEASVNDEFLEKVDKILNVMGIYNNRSDYVREAVRRQLKEDAKYVQDMDFSEL